MITWVTGVTFLLALIPAVLFVVNLRLYSKLPQADCARHRCSVLIPARNEEALIADAVNSVLQSAGIDLEVVVLDDASTDRTKQIVKVIAARDSRVRLETARPLPVGWCGKNSACQQLAEHARHPILVFMDADVRLSSPNSLVRLVSFLEQSGAALVSGVPLEITRSFAEKLIIPLIHFVLLGFLPLRRMRAGTDPRFSAACGQILAVQRDAYEKTTGHAAIADRIHDAVALTRNFRSCGFRTDLFDATDTFRCRMYCRTSEVWSGFAKNAHEGLATPRLIVPTTVLLLGGQVIPFLFLLLLAFGVSLPTAAICLSAMAAACALLPRLIGVARFHQSLLGALFHPLGISTLVLIQWFAFLQFRRKRAVSWKGRSYSPAPAL